MRKKNLVPGIFMWFAFWGCLGLTLAAQAAGVERETLVVFTSDNGASPSAASSAIAEGHQPNKPYRGGKAQLLEGGHLCAGRK